MLSDAPSVRERQLAAELRRLRVGAQLDGRQAAARLGWSASKVSRIETSRTGVGDADLQRLLDLYRVPQEQREELARLQASSNTRKAPWWARYRDALTSSYEQYLAFEDAAHSVFEFQLALLPGWCRPRTTPGP